MSPKFKVKLESFVLPFVIFYYYMLFLFLWKYIFIKKICEIKCSKLILFSFIFKEFIKNMILHNHKLKNKFYSLFNLEIFLTK
jgi:hypothetical protein